MSVWTRRAVVVLLAVPSLVIAVLSLATLDTSGGASGWTVQIALWVLTGMAGLLSIPISAASSDHPAAGGLSVGLAGLAACFAVSSGSAVIGLPSGGGSPLLSIALLAVGTSGLVRFFAMFPERPSDELIESLLGSLSLREGSLLENPRSRSQFKTAVRLAADGRMPFACASVVAVTLGGFAIGTAFLSDATRGLVFAFTVLPSLVLVIVEVASGLALSLLLRARFAVGDEQERNRILWVAASMSLVFTGSGWLMIAGWVFSFISSDNDLVWALVTLGIFSAWFLALVGLAVATFRHGALDPRLAVRRTTLYGSVGLILLFVFGALEVFLSDFVLSRLGAPEGTATWLAGGSVAIAFGPLRAKFKTGIDRWMDDHLPATVLAETPRHEAVIVFADIVGYTRLASESEDDALTTLSVFHRVARKETTKRAGTLVKTMGDGVLMEFKTVSDAVEAVRALSRSLAAALEPLDLPRAPLRTGIHVGQVARRRDGDLFGDAVNLASRLEGTAEPGGIVLSQAAASQLGDSVELEDLGARTLKNVPEPVRCFVLAD